MRKILLTAMLLTAVVAVSGWFSPQSGLKTAGGGGARLTGGMAEDGEEGNAFTLTANSKLPFAHYINLQYRYIPGFYGVYAGQEASTLVAAKYFLQSGNAENLYSKEITALGLYQGDSLYVHIDRVALDDSSLVLDTYEIAYLIDHSIDTWMWRLDDSPCTSADDSLWAYADAGAAAAAGVTYDRVFTDTDGSLIKFGTVQNNTTYDDSLFTATLSLYGHSEYSYTPSAQLATNQRLTFLWFDMSDLPAGCQIESAYIVVASDNIAGTTFSMAPSAADGFPRGISCRLDTISSDLRMLDQTRVNTDPSRFNITWNRMLGGVAGSEWSPPLIGRADWNDFGPRAANTMAWPLAAGLAMRLDVTDAVQQHINSGRPMNGPFIFTQTPDGGGPLRIGRVFGDNPQLVIRFKEHRTKELPWGDGKVPFVFVFDDAHDEQAAFCAMLDAAGMPYSLAISGNYAVDGADRLGIDNIMSLYSGGADIILHSRTHPDMGGLTDAQCRNQLYRSWWATALSDAAMDSSSVEWQDFAWPVAGGDTYGLNAIKNMIRMGYRSARSAGSLSTWDADVGTFQPYSWSDPVNIYTGSTWFAAFAYASEDSCRDLLRDAIDESYTRLGKGAIVTYYHTTNDISVAELTTLIATIQEFSSCLTVTTLEDVVSARLNGAGFIDPGDAVIGSHNQRKTPIRTAAANWDSLVTAGETYADSVWVEGK